MILLRIEREHLPAVIFPGINFMIMKVIRVSIIVFLITIAGVRYSTAQSSTLDAKVEAFLKKHKGAWHNLNVPYEDGKVLHDLIVSHHYTSALEIGTSTGHSTIWIAWAMSKMGGKV